MGGARIDDTLLEVVLKRLSTVPLATRAEQLLLAACDSDTALAAQLSDQASTGSEHLAANTAANPAGAYLRSITVSGFRGIGAAATLDLEPGPGLTMIVGRNGSGKSSFAEGLEMLLTGGLRRWQEPVPVIWRAAWRNLHAPGEVRLSADLLLEDGGRTIAQRVWDTGADLADSRADVQVAGEKRTDMSRLDWDDLLITYRPFLSHSELETFLRGPSQLYDLLSSVLGLEDLQVADKRLAAARKERDDAVKGVNADLPALLDRLGSAEDERARSCREALSGRQRDVAQALSIATGSAAAQPDGEIGRLRLLSQLTVPAREEIDAAAAALRAAAVGLARAAGSEAGQALDLAKLLTAAIGHYHVHGAGQCPVCGRADALDEQWREQTEQQIARLKTQASEAQQAHTAALEARAKAQELFAPPPAALTGSPIRAANPAPGLLAWQAWAKYPAAEGADGLCQLADHLEESWSGLSQAVMALAKSAQDELRDREDLWAPLARDVAAWCTRAQDIEAEAEALPALKAAITWLKNATDDIRNDRLAPLGEQARAIWSMLRQESNVDLGAIRLSGSGPRRQVDVKVSVDGSDCTALGVMSQGEVNALALSIFLPRATIPASPFRFLVIDDPVQAMDPAKVEGLARVLEDVARSRQVLVFTHDDRLPEAVRRLGITGRILEVSRRPGSIVEVRPALTPVERLLKDAHDMCADDAVPQKVAGRVIPGLCRMAVEATFTEAIHRVQLSSGKRHAEVEAEVEAADKLSKKAALAMFGNATKGGDVLPRLDGWRHSAASTYKALNKGAHDTHAGSLRALVSDTRALTELIREKLA
jgi:recombinational DNA repair ATPase RecF